MRFLKKVEIYNIFIIQVKRSTFVKFQLKIDENNLNIDLVLGGKRVVQESII